MGKSNRQSNLKLENAVLFCSVSSIPCPIVRPPYPIAVKKFLSLDQKNQNFPILLSSDVCFKFNFSHSGCNQKNLDKIAIIVPYANIPKELRNKIIGNTYEVNIFAEFLFLKELKPVILLPKSMQEAYQASILSSIGEITTSYYDNHLTLKDAFSNYASEHNIPIFKPLEYQKKSSQIFTVINGFYQQKINAMELFGFFFRTDNYVECFNAHPLSLFQNFCLQLQKTIKLGQPKCELMTGQLKSIDSFLQNKAEEIFYGNDAEYENATSFMRYVTSNIKENQTISMKDISKSISDTTSKRKALYQERYSKCNIKTPSKQKESIPYDFKILTMCLTFCSAFFNSVCNAISSVAGSLGKLDLKNVLLTLFKNINEMSPEKLAERLNQLDTTTEIECKVQKRGLPNSPPKARLQENQFSDQVTQGRISRGRPEIAHK